MILSERIWQALGPLSAQVELVDHDNGTVRYKADASQIDKDAISAIVAAHDWMHVLETIWTSGLNRRA